MATGAGDSQILKIWSTSPVVYEAAKPCGLHKSEIHKYTEQVATTLGLEPGGDLIGPVTKLGGIVRVVSSTDLSDTRDGSIAIEPEGQFKISLADNVGPPRNSFTIAHELGHYFLHRAMRSSNENGFKAVRYGTG